ncbi:pentapeptide repeat-containing protein [Embleya sp. NBC_00888]|uniref:pentapeptide repeat-containing protein n=1 Tax=Embleya sp. NBC_00888 TaxID=2975960 RepID=UPI00386830A1|nr:pentapeptide repeat-containing protein [Embleya sp. NBC_00888]
MTPPPLILTLPPWPHCAQGASATDPIGCLGIHVAGHTRCLTHLDPTDRTAYLATLTHGSDVDHRGTPFDQPLLTALLHALRDPTTGRPRLGLTRFDGATFFADAWFNEATFSAETRFDGATFFADAWFNEATFSAETRFDGATFSTNAWFNKATFSAGIQFDGATFSTNAWFNKATFSAGIQFDGATFSGPAWFNRATFTANTWFTGATFSANAWFNEATFSAETRFSRATFSADAQFGKATFSAETWFNRVIFSADARFDCAIFSTNAWFNRATFHSAATLGPLVCVGILGLSGVVFGAPMVIEAAAARVRCTRTRWDATATLRLRHAALDLTDAVVTQPLAVTAHPTAFDNPDGGGVVDESALTGGTGVRVVSLRGVDAAHLVLTDTDLTRCVFTGAFHLDQLRLTGHTLFANTPTGTHWRLGVPWRWTRRRVLAEEHHWRATRTPPTNPTTPTNREWTPGPHHPDPDHTPGPDDLAPVYRDLRKAFEDGKNEPDAADFYYAETEMRRKDRERPRAERGLLTAYWALSGYGLRASRALTWLLLAMTATILSMMLWGLPTDDPKPHTVGIQAQPGQRVDLVTDNPDPVLTGSPHERLSGKRAEKATRVVLNSVVFRSSGQNLTTAGTYIEMTSRFLEPVLLALAVLAIRGRVKR